MRWLTDPTGLLPKLLTQCQTIDDARSIFVHVVRQGQVVASADHVQYFDIRELAVILSFHLEALDGADIGARYAWYGCVAPEATVYGTQIVEALDEPAAASDPASSPEARLARLGLRVEQIEDWRIQGRLSRLLGPKYTVDVGRDFS